MSNLEQLIRIGLYVGGSYFLGDAVANGEMYQAAIGGVLNVVSFGWWFISKNAAK